MSISTNVFRTGKKYRLINYGDRYEFVIERFVGSDFLLKDLHTLENYYYQDLVRFGKSEDFVLEEIQA